MAGALLGLLLMLVVIPWSAYVSGGNWLVAWALTLYFVWSLKDDPRIRTLVFDLASRGTRSRMYGSRTSAFSFNRCRSACSRTVRA